jgi:ABC-type branched-subunit amino acid transport system ATPase component
VTTLSCQDVTVGFGGVVAVDGVSVHVSSGEVVGLIGSNGAGKTTLFEVLSGFLKPDGGRVLLDGDDVTGVPVHERARRGIARGFQDARLYPAMIVSDVIALSLDRHKTSSRTEEVLQSFGLDGYRDHTIGELSTGTRRVVEIAGVCAQDPVVVLLDEPSAGVAAAEAAALRDLLKRLQRERDVAMLLVEHDVPMVMQLSDRVYVMETGAILAEGTPKQIMRDKRVIEAYFGTRAVKIGR